MAPLPAELTLAGEVEAAFHQQVPECFFVASRVLRRVLRHELEITSPLIRLPHRKTYVIERDRLLWLAARDELGVEPHVSLPSRLMLIARPEEDVLAKFDRSRLLRYYWQLVYHARLDFQLLEAASPARLSTAALRERIDRIGQTEFDEVRAVLRQEAMLLHPDDPRQVYAEFAAVYFELHSFSPELLPLYFPSLRDASAVRNILQEDCPADEILQSCTPADLKQVSPSVAALVTPPSDQPGSGIAPSGYPSEWKCRQRLRRAQRFHEQGNSVRAALWFQQAAAVAPPGLLEDAQAGVQTELDTLVTRLQAALELTDELAATWRRIFTEIARQTSFGFWNANIRLLYDLQKVCLDHERETYRVDLWKWLRSFGKEPIKRALPNQRIVLMSKHLYSATRRLGSVQLSASDRQELSHLLRESASAAERLLRKRLEPYLAHSLHDTGFMPQSVVEEVAFDKMVDELLDGVVHRGFLTLGDLRDAISRNQVKMPDLADAKEFLVGDPLLRADERFSLLLEGVYQRGPWYLRWLQRIGSLIFGTSWGRSITLFLALPYGGAFVAIRGIEHLVDMFRDVTGQSPDEEQQAHPASAADSPPQQAAADAPSGSHTETAAAETARAPDAAPADGGEPPPAPPQEEVFPPEVTHPEHHTILDEQQLALAVATLGTVIFVLMHFPGVRAGVLRILESVWRAIRWTAYDLPIALLKFPFISWLIRSLPVMLFRRYLLTPLILTLAYWKILPGSGITETPRDWQVWVFLTLTVAVFLSRLGRDTEELFWDWVGRTWYRVRVHLIVGLFTFVIDLFRQIMDGVERVLYAVDEWLRFRTGESNVTLAIKAVLGAVWSVIHGVIRFAVTLLIEPQINPIKHFPVVTVSHKLLVFTIPHMAIVLSQFFDKTLAGTLATLIVTAIPGVFGFLAWEFKENWKLYAANRAPRLKPVVVGSHGETLLRLLAPGFHSGTIPKLFAKRRRNARKSRFHPERNRQARFEEQLHHIAEGVEHFIKRELLAILKRSRAFEQVALKLSDVRLSTNRIIVEIRHPASDKPMQLTISEQSGWLVAGITQPGWVKDQLDERQQRVLQAALAGTYKLGAVDLVREQIESRFADPGLAYDIAETGLVVWPHRDFDKEITYALDEQPQSVPRPRSAARAAGLSPLPISELAFQKHEITWDAWDLFWREERTSSTVSELLEIRLLPVNSRS